MVAKVRARKHKQERRFERIMGDRDELNLDQPINSEWRPIESLLIKELQKTEILSDSICLISSHIEVWQVAFRRNGSGGSGSGFYSLSIQSLGSQEEMGCFVTRKLSSDISGITKRQSPEISGFLRKRSFSQPLSERQCEIITRGDKYEACETAKAIITKTLE